MRLEMKCDPSMEWMGLGRAAGGDMWKVGVKAKSNENGARLRRGPVYPTLWHLHREIFQVVLHARKL